MPKPSRNRSYVAGPKSPASSQRQNRERTQYSPQAAPISTQRVNIVDYALDLQEANTQLQRMLRMQGIGPDSRLQNNRKEQSAARSRMRSQVLLLPKVTSKNHQSTRPTITYGNARQVLDCLGRKVRRELVHAFGGGGSRKKQPNRRTASKTRC